jgi:[FeFe] hydrogenase H-cluster maturation GTPase HydF
MSLTDTPQSNRLHIILIGRRNSGKSSMINALTGQDVSLVSDVAGTTTDPVLKAMEIHGIGPCLFIDTPGFDDEGVLGTQRVERTMKAVEKADIALLFCNEVMNEELSWIERLKEKHIPVVPVLNKSDLLNDVAAVINKVEQQCGLKPIPTSAIQGTGIQEIRQAIIRQLPEDYDAQTITGELVSEGDLVLLVMPQDIQAPKGRLILPQVQTIRELLDKKCLVMSCTTDKLQAALAGLSNPPKLIITDSQVFKTVYEQKPKESLLTSFSVLFATLKGDIRYFVDSAAAIAKLTPQSKVLIAEACTHAPLTEDIGRVKIPRLLRKKVGEQLQIDIVAGNDFPADLSAYDLVIHCGACMFNRKYVLSRIEQARRQQVPMTNYGITIAWLSGILDKISL